ncbi:replicative DNA helicase [Candidatus Chlamydia sanziniae]|uniref:DNA 5'-3' helicase n=1 Tax=Candidatus Chlamydia sanziniae TaxID=1806891 RepID=A0A1A9HYL4_9CHLA|nr:DnaB-like helicase C-terminal domain-containing protein [Candidatus Chlamydia sanziniae]ANH79173.1 Replicative DNA helicase [Candidatus Chlamydia sanziniae]
MTSSQEEKEYLDAEFFVLGQAINYTENAQAIVSRLSEEHFSFYNHKKIFGFIKILLRKRETVSIALLWEEIKQQNYDTQLDVSYLIQMSQSADISIDLNHHIDFLHEKHTNNLLKEFLDTSYNDFTRYPNRRSPFTLIDQFKEHLDVIHSKISHPRRNFIGKTVYNILKGDFQTPGLLEKIRAIHAYKLENKKDFIDGLLTGYAAIDEQSTLLCNGSFVVIAARPSMGKTAFAIDIALYLSLEQKKSVGFISLEMNPGQIVERMISNLSEISCEQLKRGSFSTNALGKIEAISAAMQGANFFICDGKCSELKSLIDQARVLKDIYNINVLFIDYIQLIRSDKRNENRQNEIAEISRSLRALATELEIPIVCLSQLSRKVEDRSEKRPLLSDLRDSGQIEQDADVILLLYRKDYYSQEATKGLAEVIIGKNRHGAVFSAHLIFNSSIGKFYNQKEAW